MSSRRILVSAATLCLVIAIGAWSAVAAFPTQAGVNTLFLLEAGPVEQRASAATTESLPRVTHAEPATVPAVADAERAAATVTLRTVVDESGNVAEVRLAGFSISLDGFTASMAAGASLDKFAGFSKQARVDRGGTTVASSSQRPLVEALVESAAAAVRQSRYEAPINGAVYFNTIVRFTPGTPLGVTSTAPAPDTRVTPVGQRMAADGAIRVGGNVKPPVKVKDVRPVYPQDARDAGVQGVVILDVRIEPDGRVGNAQVLRSIPMLDQAALDAVAQWEFAPTLLNGAPVAVIMTVTIQFTMP